MTSPPARPGRLAANVELSGLGLRLREWTDDDLPAMVELFDDADVDRWTPLRSPFDLAAARTYLEQSRSRRALGAGIQLAVTTDGRAALGEVLLTPTGPAGVDPEGRTAELAYAVGAAHRRQGLAARAVRLMTDYAYRVLGMDEVILRIAPDNLASIAVARATGFERTDRPPVVRRAGEPLLTWLHPLSSRAGNPSA